MGNDEIQNEPPQIQKEPSHSDARWDTRLPLADDNRFQRPDPARESERRLTALCLGIVSLILSGGWLMMMTTSLPNQSASFRLG